MDIFHLQKEYVTTLIHDTIETYPGPWRLVHEGSQNAADAIQRNGKIKSGKIDIELRVGTNRVSISDNGCGISVDRFASMFQLGGGDKRDEELRKLLKGSQGVGIKATCYTSTHFEVRTIHDGRQWNYTAKGFDKFAEPNFRREITPPKPVKTSEPSGTTIEYTLANYSVLDFLNEVVTEYLEDSQAEEITNVEQLKIAVEQYFRTKTYVGCVLRLLGTNTQLKPITVQVSIVFDHSSIAEHKKLPASGWEFIADTTYHGRTINHEFPGTYLDAAAIHAALAKTAKADKFYSHFEEVLVTPPDPTLRKILIQKLDRVDVERFLYKTKRDPKTNSVVLEKDSDAIRRHQRALDRVNGIYLVISQRNYMGKYLHLGPRQFLSVNGLPTNIALNTPGGALGYLNNIHLVMDVDVTLGFGKRNIPGRTKGIIDALFADIWRMLRRVCPPIVGVKEGKDPTEFETWDKDAEYDAYRDGSNNFRDLPLSLKITPQTEQEVAALLRCSITSSKYECNLGSEHRGLSV